MTATSVLLLFVIFALIAVLPVWPHSKRLGILPTGIVGLVLVAVLVTYLARGGA